MSVKSYQLHGLWAVAVIVAFVVGQRQAPSNSEPASSDGASSGLSATPSSRPGSDSGPGRVSSTRPDGNQTSTDSFLADLLNLSPANPGNLEALTLEALRDPNQVKRRLAFSRLLQQMTPENAAAMRDQLVAAGAEGSEWRDFNYAWGALAGEEAFNNSLTSDRKNLESLISGWAATDPAGAIRMLDKLPPELSEQKKELENGIVAGLADRDRDEATQYIASLVAGGREDAARLMETVANEVLRKGDPAEASAWVAGITDEALKAPAMARVAERYVRSDPEAAAGWVEQFAEQDYASNAVQEIGRTWARREPLAAVSWLDQLPGGPGQKAGLNSAFGDWEDKDPIAAGKYLLSMPDSPKRDSAISGFARGYAWQDPETAIAWANDIKDPGLRTESLKRVGYAYLRRDPEGARTWLANSGLPANVQAEIQSGRRRR